MDVAYSINSAGASALYVLRGGFGAAGEYLLSPSFASTAGTIGADLDVGDCDGDGDLDIVVVGPVGAGNALRVFANNGSGGFAESVTMSPGPGTDLYAYENKLNASLGFTPHTLSTSPFTRVGVIDLDGNRLPDLVVGSSTGVELFRNAGAYSFVSLPWGSSTSPNATDIEVGDLNGDQLDDFVVASSSVGGFKGVYPQPWHHAWVFGSRGRYSGIRYVGFCRTSGSRPRRLRAVPLASVYGEPAMVQSMWSGAYADLHVTQARYSWTRDDNDNDSKPRLKWRLNAPRQAEVSLRRDRNLYVQIAGVPPGDSTCVAAAPTATGCHLGRYQCRAGATVCGAADDRVCNTCRDFDGDGFDAYDPVTCATGRDCNDTDPQTYPGADEQCNGLDNDCDGIADVKDDAAYAVLWSEPVPASAQKCPVGDPTCGPKECRYEFACICPDGPEDPDDPPATPCRCGEGLTVEEAVPMSMAPAEASPEADVEVEADADADASCATTAGDASWLLLLGVFGWRRRKV